MLRKALADEAARLMIEHGIEDFGLAKRKASIRLGATDHSLLPSNLEVETALQDRQRLFAGETHAEQVDAQRQAALTAMAMLRSFEPRLAGAVLSGSATAHSPIELHVFADAPESVVVALLDAGVDHRDGTRRFRAARTGFETYPTLSFDVGGHDVEVTVFPRDGLRQAPSSPIDGRPMKRATALDVELLLAGERT